MCKELNGLKGKQVRILYDLVTVIEEQFLQYFDRDNAEMNATGAEG